MSVSETKTTISDEIEEKILSMYNHGMSYKDIASHIEDIYQINISTVTISAVTDKIISKVKEWQARLLEPIYPFEKKRGGSGFNFQLSTFSIF